MGSHYHPRPAGIRGAGTKSSQKEPPRRTETFSRMVDMSNTACKSRGNTMIPLSYLLRLLLVHPFSKSNQKPQNKKPIARAHKGRDSPGAKVGGKDDISGDSLFYLLLQWHKKLKMINPQDFNLNGTKVVFPRRSISSLGTKTSQLIKPKVTKQMK